MVFIDIYNLEKVYNIRGKTSTKALVNVSLSFPQSGMIFVVGKSGCGKSTLLNILGGLDKPTSGEVIFDGKKICYDKEQYLDAHRKENIGFIFQDHLLVDDFTVEENVKSVLELQGKTVSNEKIKSILEAVGISDIADKLPNALSGGQRQRVAIARALIKSPRVILADEPTGNLDSESGKIVFDILKKIAETVLVIVVSHDLDSAYRYADRIIELKDGEVCSDKQKTGNFDLDELKRRYNEAIDKSYTDTAITTDAQDTEFVESGISKTKSQLPVRNAFATMWKWLKASLLKPKNLIATLATILVLSLSLAALGIFNDIRMFNFENATSSGLQNTKYNTVLLLKRDLLNIKNDEAEDAVDVAFSSSEISDIDSRFSGAYKTYYYGINFDKFVDEKNDYYRASLTGLCEMSSIITEKELSDFYDAKLIVGNYPRKNKNAIEILISDYTAESILFYGGIFDNGAVLPNTPPENLIGKVFENNSIYFKIVGIYESQFSYLFKEKADKENAELSFARNYVFPIGLCAKDAVPAIASTIMGIDVSMNLRQLNDEMSFNYHCQLLSVNSYNTVSQIADANGIEITFSTDFDSVFQENDMIIAYSRYLDLFNLYEYNAEGELISSFQNLSADALNNLVVVEEYHDKTINYRVVGVFDDHSAPSGLTIVSHSVKDRYLQELLQIPTVFLSLKENKIPSLISYCKDAGYHIFAAFSERLYYFGILFDMLGNTIAITTAVILLFVVMLLFIVIGRSLREREKDIGILRALGANKIDIVKIFILNDLFYILMSFVFSVIFYFVGITMFNISISSRFGVSVTILSGSIFSILIMLLTAALVVFVASYLPVKKCSNVPPIDVIRGAE